MKTMLETPHVVVGAAIASKIGNPLLSIPLALCSHFLLEQIPHWNPHLNQEMKKFGKVTSTTKAVIAVDVVLSLFLGGLIASKKLPDMGSSVVILIAAFASILPDLVEAPYFFFGYNHPLLHRWLIFQKKLQSDATIFPGLLTQIVTIAVALWWVL
jgi:hypothetical protein